MEHGEWGMPRHILSVRNSITRFCSRFRCASVRVSSPHDGAAGHQSTNQPTNQPTDVRTNQAPVTDSAPEDKVNEPWLALAPTCSITNQVIQPTNKRIYICTHAHTLNTHTYITIIYARVHHSTSTANPLELYSIYFHNMDEIIKQILWYFPSYVFRLEKTEIHRYTRALACSRSVVVFQDGCQAGVGLYLSGR